jgi:hypothetical protein
MLDEKLKWFNEETNKCGNNRETLEEAILALSPYMV